MDVITNLHDPLELITCITSKFLQKNWGFKKKLSVNCKFDYFFLLFIFLNCQFFISQNLKN